MRIDPCDFDVLVFWCGAGIETGSFVCGRILLVRDGRDMCERRVEVRGGSISARSLYVNVKSSVDDSFWPFVIR